MNEYFEKIAEDAYNDEMSKIAGTTDLGQSRRNLAAIQASADTHQRNYSREAGRQPRDSAEALRIARRAGDVSPTRDEILPAETEARRLAAISRNDLARAKRNVSVNVANKATEDMIANRAK